MSRKQKWVYTVVLGVVSITLLVLCLTTVDKGDRSVQFHNDIPSYEHTLASFDHSLHIAYETQAVPLMEAGIVKAYRSDFISTIIIAVDRDQVKDEISG